MRSIRLQVLLSSQIHKVPKFKSRPPTKSRRKKTQSFSDFESPPVRPRAKIPGSVEFIKQVSRPPITNCTNDVNENRFLKFNDMPENYSISG